MIYTTYFANMKNLPADVVPIAISQFVPKGINIPRYPMLAPSQDILLQYKNDGNWEEYTKKYMAQISNMCPVAVLRDLIEMAGTDEIALVCYEGKDKNCHRHLVAEWFKECDIEVEEY